MPRTVTTRYDVAEHLRTPEEMAAYLEVCLEEADGDASTIAKSLTDVARAREALSIPHLAEWQNFQDGLNRFSPDFMQEGRDQGAAQERAALNVEDFGRCKCKRNEDGSEDPT